MEPKKALSVSQWARDNTNFDLDALPWHSEVMDALSDPETAEVGLLGPAQAGKSTIGLSWVGWTVDQAPDNFFLCQPDRSATTKFVVSRIDPFIEDTDAVKSKLSRASNANNQFLKQFQGMFLFNVWPVPGQFIQVPARYGWLDDFDQMDEDIGGTEEKDGQGSAIKLLEGRLTTRKGRDTKFVSSSPADETGGKTEAFVAAGTDERLWPQCPSCGDRWQIDLKRDLHFDRTGDEDLAEKTAHVVCGNGCMLAPSDRRALLNSLSVLPNRGFVPERAEASRRRRGFRIDGLLAFTSWPDLARELREAERTWEARQDEGPLRTFWNTKAGVNYRSVLSGEKPIAAAELKKRREKVFQLGTVPAGVKTIVILVDAQANSFQCAAVGWGDGLESWLIDRWAIEVLEDGLTSVTPFSKPEHAEMLLPLWNRSWPLADGSGRSPPPLAVAIDTGGGGKKGDSWTESVKRLWHKATEPMSRDGWGIHRSRVVLLKGGNNPKGKLMPPAEFADRKLKGSPKRNAPQLWLPNVHKIKNIVDARLRRDTFGPGYIHFPGADRPGAPKRERFDPVRGLEDEYFEEITAEELRKGRWEKVRPRNETLDHLVYAYAVLLMPGRAQSKTDMRWVPAAYRVPDQIVAVASEGLEQSEIEHQLPSPPEPTITRRQPDTKKPVVKPAVRINSNWLNRRRR